MRQLLGRANSSNVMKVVWLLEEMGLPYQRLDVGGKFGGNDTPDYRALNPNGVVPTLIEDDFVLWESNAILRYLAASHPEGVTFWPTAPQARAKVDRWMDWLHTMLGPQMTPVFWNLIRHAPADRDQAVIAKATARLIDLYAILDRQLGTNPYLAGPTLTLCDIAIGPQIHRWFNFEGIDRPDYPNLRAWYDRLLARPVYREHVAQLPLT